MDEFENKLNPEASGGPEAPDEELKGELENIRDLLQKEIDAAEEAAKQDVTYEAPDGEVLIQSLEDMGLETEDGEEAAEDDADISDDGDEADEFIDEEDLCRCCGEKRRDVDFGEDYPYCADCREMMKHNPINPMGVLVTILVVLVAALSFGLMTTNINDYSSLADAQAAYDGGKLSTALVGYLGYMNEVDTEKPHSSSALRYGTELLTKLGYYDYALDYINRFYDDKDLSKPWNKTVAEDKEYNETLGNTLNYVSENLGDDMNAGEFDKVIKALDKLIEENAEKPEDERFNAVYLEYAKYFMMTNRGDDQQDILDQLLKVEKTDDELYGGKNSWMYLDYLLRQYSRLGDADSAKACFDRVMDINSQDVYAYVYYSDLFRFSVNEKSSEDELKASAEEIRKIAALCAETFEPEFSYPIYYRLYALSYLLSGEYDTALTNMETYLNEAGGNLSVSDFNLYALCAVAAEDNEKYEQIESNLQMQGYSLSKSVTKLAAGKGSVIKIITDNGGDI